MSLVPDTQGGHPQYNAFSPSSVCTPPLHFAPVSIISPIAQSSLLHSHTHPSPLTWSTHPSPVTSHPTPHSPIPWRYVHPSPLTSHPSPVTLPPSLTWSTLSFCTPNLPPKPLAASVWDSCLESWAWYSHPTALWRGREEGREGGRGGEGRLVSTQYECGLHPVAVSPTWSTLSFSTPYLPPKPLE